MRFRLPALSILIFLTAFSSFAKQGHMVRVSGGTTNRRLPAPNFDISIDYRQAAGAPACDGVAVFAEPSHTLLLALINSKAKRPDSVFSRLPAGPRGTGDFAAASQRSSLLYHPAVALVGGKGVRRPTADSRLDVIVYREGVAHVVTRARVNFSRFRFTSLFDIGAGGGPVNETQCCGDNCGCVDCGAKNNFCCDMINCKASCSKNCPDLVLPSDPVGWQTP